MIRARIVVTALVACSATSCAVDFVLFSGRSLSAYGFDAFEGERLDDEALDLLGAAPAGAIREERIESGDETLGLVVVSDAEVTAADTVIVYFHGSARHLDYYWPRVRLLHATGYPVVAVDYRGYGVSTGSSDVPSVLTDARATMRFVEEELGGPRVVVFGNSLGTIAAARMAAEIEVTGLILEVPINSLETAVADQFGASVPAEALFERDVSVRQDAATSGAPLLVFAADSDELFPPVRHADRVFSLHQEESGAAAQIIRVPGGHDDVPSDRGYDTFVADVRDFIAGL